MHKAAAICVYIHIIVLVFKSTEIAADSTEIHLKPISS